jgi:hypothetical protein
MGQLVSSLWRSWFPNLEYKLVMGERQGVEPGAVLRNSRQFCAAPVRLPARQQFVLVGAP